MVDLIIPNAQILKANPAKIIITQHDLITNPKLIHELQNLIETALEKILGHADDAFHLKRFSDFAKLKFQTIQGLRNIEQVPGRDQQLIPLIQFRNKRAFNAYCAAHGRINTHLGGVGAACNQFFLDIDMCSQLGIQSDNETEKFIRYVVLPSKWQVRIPGCHEINHESVHAIDPFAEDRKGAAKIISEFIALIGEGTSSFTDKRPISEIKRDHPYYDYVIQYHNDPDLKRLLELGDNFSEIHFNKQAFGLLERLTSAAGLKNSELVRILMSCKTLDEVIWWKEKILDEKVFSDKDPSKKQRSWFQYAEYRLYKELYLPAAIELMDMQRSYMRISEAFKRK